MRGGTSERRIVADSQAAMSLGIEGTPLVLVNGWRVDGAPPEETLQNLILKARR